MSVLERVQAAEWFIANRDKVRVSFLLTSEDSIAAAAAEIDNGETATLADFTLPTDKYLLVVSFGGSVGGSPNACVEYQLSTPTLVFPWYLVVDGSSIYEHQFEVPTIVSPGGTLNLSAITDANNTQVSGFVTGVLGEVIGPAV